jgi:CubicO group peptidase (beta-lactamase class C family)
MQSSYLSLAAAHIDEARFAQLCEHLRHWCEADLVPSAAFCVGRKDGVVEPRFFGRQAPTKDAPALREDSLFLVASITKPFTVAAAMILVERGELTLSDPVAKFVPAFAAEDKGGVQVRHLMTHTSGLPDQLPDNIPLRMAHRPFSAFIGATCALKLLYTPGMQVGYQSMGIAMLAEIVRRVSGKTLPEFLRHEVFGPLGMNDTWLGLPAEQRDRLAVVREPKEMLGSDWGWMSPYWLGFGAPWGGLLTTPEDLSRFCRMMLNGGTLDKARVLSPATVRAMTTNQLAAMPQVPDEDRRCRPWGLGWRLNWPGSSANFGDLLGPRAYGHWGSTGTVCWIDPDTDAFCILLTTQPQESDGRYLSRVCNLAAAMF